MKNSRQPVRATHAIAVSGTRAAMSIFNDPAILDARKREVLTEYLFEFLPSDIHATRDIPLLDGSTALRLTAMKKSRRSQLIIIGAYLVHLSQKNGAENDTKKTTKSTNTLE